ncbi:RNA polymerase sigma factor [Variovorax sp. GB1P17]|uniref:RNA polymerase sigma factor n=1 Tax=Variovorax sp. GB1P17 TaxID=3443740 RepID=UPI003F45EBCB
MNRGSLPSPAHERDDTASANGQLASLYARWRKPLVRLFRGRLGNHEKAEEAAQDVFVRMAVAGKSLAPEEEEPYLRTTARSVSLDEWRRNGRSAAPEVVSMETAANELAALPADDRQSPLELAAHRERLQRLDEAVAELPERQRQAFLLNRIDGLSHDEVAAAMGISARMVAKHLQRAMAYCQLRVKYPSLQRMTQLHVHDETGDEERQETP